MANLNHNYQGVPTTTVTRDMRKLEAETGNLYETIAIISKRANQISAQMKEELHNKLNEFDNDSDTLEEIFENREQIEISRFYERLPKPNAVAVQELLEDKIYHRYPDEPAAN